MSFSLAFRGRSRVRLPGRDNTRMAEQRLGFGRGHGAEQKSSSPRFERKKPCSGYLGRRLESRASSFRGSLSSE